VDEADVDNVQTELAPVGSTVNGINIFKTGQGTIMLHNPRDLGGIMPARMKAAVAVGTEKRAPLIQPCAPGQLALSGLTAWP
jgi:hypothetical protein